jgi:molecular chaperone GrpE
MTWRIYQHPSESNAEGEESVESIASPVDPTAQLQAEINTAKAEVAEWQDRFLRKAAEFENYRKRAEKEKTDSAILAKGSVLAEFLPIADACERALKTLNEARSAPGSLQQFQDGVELLYKQVLDALGRTGVTPMKTEGKRFDPHLHEALSREEASEFEEGMVVKELRRGYLFKDKLLRPAQVVVSIKGKDRTSQ